MSVHQWTNNITASQKQCPKCGATSGDDWSQCAGHCPMSMSPHYSSLDKVDVTHTTTAGKLPVGIKWNAEEWRVPVDYKKRLRLVFAGYVRVPLSLKFYPTILGDGFELKPGKNDLVRELWWNKFHVGEVIENPNGQGLPFDGPGLPPPPNQKLLPAPQKQEPEFARRRSLVQM